MNSRGLITKCVVPSCQMVLSFSTTCLAALIAKHVHHDGLSLREAAVRVEGVRAEDCDRWVEPGQMLGLRH